MSNNINISATLRSRNIPNSSSTVSDGQTAAKGSRTNVCGANIRGQKSSAGGTAPSSRRSSITSVSSRTSRSSDKGRLRLRSIPRAANWGWGHLPFSAKVMIVGVFSGLVSLTTPHWAYIKTEYVYEYSSFGLWHYCTGDKCSSIHDNLVPGRSVPMWYHMTQGSLCIGVACSIIGLAMITNSIEGKVLKMTITVHRAAACVLGISDNTDFLYERSSNSGQIVDFYGSFYMGVVSFISSTVAALAVYLDDSICHRPKPLSYPSNMSMSGQDALKTGLGLGSMDYRTHGYSPPTSPPPGYDYTPLYYQQEDYPPEYNYTSNYDQCNYPQTEGGYPLNYDDHYPFAEGDLPPGYVWGYPEGGDEEEEGGSFGAHQWSNSGDVGSSFTVNNTQRLPPIEEQPF